MSRKKAKSESVNKSNSFGFNVKEAFSIKPRIEISDNTCAVIDGSCGVLEYSETVIRVSLGEFSLKLSGRGLSLKCISPTSLIVGGFIKSVEYIM